MIFGPIKMKDLSFINIAKEVIKVEYNSLKKLQSSIGNSFEKLINTILNCKNGKIIISGVGKSGIIGRKWAATFHRLAHHLFLRCLKCKSWRYGTDYI